MSRDSRWIEDQISEVMGYVRGAKSDPSIIDQAEAALKKLHDVAVAQDFPEKGAVVASIESAMTEVEGNHATAAVQHLSRALMLVSRSRI